MGEIKNTTIGITGMTCAACSSRIEKVLNRMDGADAIVNLSTEKASIKYDPEKITVNDINNKIENLGYGVLIESVELDIFGMTCAACSSRIEKVLNRQEGIDKAIVNLATEEANIAYNPEMINLNEIINKIKNLGYDAQSKVGNEEKATHKEKTIKKMKTKLTISAILSLPLIVTMFVHLFNMSLPSIFMNPWFQFTLATPVQFIIGWQFYVGAYKNLKNGGANMDVLVALGTSAAYFYSLYEAIKTIGNPEYIPHLYFETSAVLITLILFGKFLEQNAKSQTTNAISSLLKLQVKEARVIRNNVEMMIATEDLVVGDRMVIKPGEKIPVDGKILKGRTSIDESMITGESIPVEKTINENVIGSTINKNGLIEVEATKVGKDTALASIVKVVEDAQGSKAPIQRLADIISGYFVPIVVGLAVITFIIWFVFVQPGQFEDALIASIAVLVIACPCALGLATPTSIMVGTGKAAENGILFKGGEHLEQTHQLNTIVLDKTGTITKGKPEVTDFTGDNEILRLLASAEKGSEHPLAEAIVAYATEQDINLLEVTSFDAIPGQGIKAIIQNKEILVGNRKLLDGYNVDINGEEGSLSEYEAEGKTAMMIAIDQRFEGIVAVADTIKETAAEAIKLIQDEGLEVIMLTGDNTRTAKAIARQVGVDSVIAEVLPEEKAEKIKELQSQRKKVAMVGDGVNDAPALAIADIGIAIGTGTEVAIEAADVTILGGELLLIPKAIKISHATIKNIKQNLFWAFGYNTAGIPIAALGLLAPWVAGAAMALSSVSVVTNALRLKKVKL
ncbi:heavy metal translocating P-type ATPase [Mammaliicoccus stepanovicii]|uniref:Copper-exporting P-type ATPase n=1 Tax=Mammaliicoccus stepanovicii TaxID=643214 RepID=A0A239YHH7_9STAP|nr:heavy metal translocating P-type ATPase [Mammaliicoccus stepanovicii]PNZ75796.1 heavy metal translocating P-type ATPase [Mammaliicoccus stepanovicii]GGI40697.1 copper-exporting P-type ATPase A [Mammaliicoccus stepanovicii]SNV57654.1 copper-transporting ATPase [Mammaliicoccus stepanovicii]